jgi:hypothetical protein
MRERNRLDALDAARLAAACTPSERLAQALELSDAARAMARSVGARWITEPEDLENKARRYPVRFA